MKSASFILAALMAATADAHSFTFVHNDSCKGASFMLNGSIAGITILVMGGEDWRSTAGPHDLAAVTAAKMKENGTPEWTEPQVFKGDCRGKWGTCYLEVDGTKYCEGVAGAPSAQEFTVPPPGPGRQPEFGADHPW